MTKCEAQVNLHEPMNREHLFILCTKWALKKAPFSFEIGALRADDQVRTGDLNLGKVALYQLSYICVLLEASANVIALVVNRKESGNFFQSIFLQV